MSETQHPEVPDTAQGCKANISIRLLGGFEIERGARRLGSDAWRSKRAASLVKILALSPGLTCQRDELLELLWPDMSPASAANNLRYTLHQARQVLSSAFERRELEIERRGDRLALSSAQPIWLDVEEFERAAGRARELRTGPAYARAIALYRGDLLPEDRYSDWAITRGESLRAIYLRLLLEAAELHAAAGDRARAIDLFERAVSIDQLSEAAHAMLMRLHAAAGQRHRALQQYEQLRRILVDELDIEPDPSVQRLYTEILAGRLPSGMGQAGEEPASPEPPPGNLPAPLTRFIGREREIARVLDLLRTSRLVTLSGPGGAGKTRLALEAARAAAHGYPDGVWLVDLSSLRQPETVPSAVASALSVSETPSKTMTSALVEALQGRQVLLVLDNCEHLLAACASLAVTLLSACPQLTVLATSREALRVPGEVVRQVPPLTSPPQAGWPDAGDLGSSEAIQLFCDRARLAHPEFELTGSNAGAVVEICQRLDGLPLAIELAAARATVVGVQELSRRLDDALAVLTSGARVQRPQHQTLRATLDWSHDLLESDEQVVFRRLAAFAGGLTLEAAEAVAGGDGIEQRDLLSLLAQLVEKSLVVVESRDDEIRYRLLETVRQYAVERLSSSGEEERIRERHAAWCLVLAERAQIALRGERQARWLERLTLEIDNLRAALGWFELQEQIENQLRLATAVTRFWWISGRPSEGRRWLAAVTEEEHAGIDLAVRARALAALGNLAMQQGDYASAQALLEECLSLQRARGDAEGLADALNDLGAVLSDQGQRQRAKLLVEESLALRRQLGDPRDIALSLGALGAITFAEGEYEQSIAHFNECLQLYRAARDQHSVAITRNNLAEALRARGDTGQAAAHFQESLELFRELGAKHGVAYLLSNLGDLARSAGNPREARERYAEALILFRELGYQQALLRVAAGQAALIAASQPDRAAGLLGAIELHRESSGFALSPSEQDDVDRAAALARERIGDEPFAAARRRGRAMSFDETIYDAAAITLADIQPAPVSPDDTSGLLSQRELEVARLISQGCTNREIAAALEIARRTADTHVSNLLRKLGLTSRSQVAAWAERHGISTSDPIDTD